MSTVTNDAKWIQTTNIDFLNAQPDAPLGNRHVPINQGLALERFKTRMNDLGINIKSEEGLLSPNGRRFIYVADVTNDMADDRGYTVGYMNYNDCTRSWTGLEGDKVFVCSNQCIRANMIAKTRHTNNLNLLLDEKIDATLDSFVKFTEARTEEVKTMKSFSMGDNEVGLALLECIRNNAMAGAKLPKLVKEWEKPRHKDFEPRTAWSFLNCMTEVNKTFSAPERRLWQAERANEIAKKIVNPVYQYSWEKEGIFV